MSRCPACDGLIVRDESSVDKELMCVICARRLPTLPPVPHAPGTLAPGHWPLRGRTPMTDRRGFVPRPGHLGDFFRWHIYQKGWLLKDVAKRVGCVPSHVTTMLRSRRPRGGNLVKLLKATHLKLKDLPNVEEGP